MEKNKVKTNFFNNRNISKMYEDWFLDYASYVILERAIPKIEDGLKPVQRRILHSMKEKYDSRYNKVANIIGNTMQYHPHGDQSIGDALINLGQKNLLIDTQGNWGDVRTGDKAAAPRYIEARLSDLAVEVSFNEDITTTQLSYDGRKNEPVSLPMKFPLLLIQGADGIAVGLSTKILPHNFTEVIKSTILILKNKPYKIFPDFETGGLIDVKNYNKGRKGSRVRIRANIEIVDKQTLKISGLPYSITTTSLIDSIVRANNLGKIKIKSIEDNTAENLEILVHLIKGISPNVTIDALYSFTNCEISIAPNCCVINNNKPEFISVDEMLKISTQNTVDLLKIELEYKLKRLNEKSHQATIEKLFIENKIYRKIEDCQTWESIIDTIGVNLKPFLNILQNQISRDDIIKLTEIKIKKISKYNHLKQIKLIKSIEQDIEEVSNNIVHIINYSIRYFEHLLKKYGKNRNRKTIIQEFDLISAKNVVVANQKLFVNRQEGFIGLKLKKDEFISRCSNIDDIIVFLKNGKYVITQINEKKYIGKNIIHSSVWKKNDKHKIYNIVYKDGKSSNSFVKRFSVTSVVRDRFYDLTQGSKDSEVIYFTENPNSESEVINIYLHHKVSAKNKLFEYDFANLGIKNRISKGNILTKYSVRKIIRKNIGESTLGGRKLWIDDNIGRLNVEHRGIYLGSFNSEDKIVSMFSDGSYEMNAFDMSCRFRMNDISIIAKHDLNKIYTILYKDGKSKNYYIKRLSIEVTTVGRRFNLISDNRGSKCILISNYESLFLHYNYRISNGIKKSKKIFINDFINVKGWKAIGKKIDNKMRMSGFSFELYDNSNKQKNDNVIIDKNKSNELTLF